MGCCTGRCFLITVCFLLLLATLERQVFDFLGYMWAPIIGNFLQIIYVIVGLFGAFQYRPKFLIVYAVWCLVWIGWNIFVICLYLEVGILTRESSILNIGTGNKSWWLDHGIGCTVTDVLNQSTTSSTATGTRYIPPEEAVTGCLLRYYYVEIIHAGIQCLLTLLAFCASCYVIHIFTEEDDSCKYKYHYGNLARSRTIESSISARTHDSYLSPDNWHLSTYVSFSDTLESTSSVHSSM